MPPVAPTDDFDPTLPSDEDATLPLDEIIRQAIEGKTLALRVCMPARVLEVSAEQTVTLQLLLKTRPTASAQSVALPPLAHVPVAMAVGQNYSIKLPIAQGDLGLALFCDRSLDAFLASDGTEPLDPADIRQHHLTDAIFVPGLPTRAQNTQDATTDLVLKNGACEVRLRDDGKVQLKNQTQEALALVDQLISALSSLLGAFSSGAPAWVIAPPGGGPAPLNPQVVTAVTQATTTLGSVQTNLATLKV